LIATYYWQRLNSFHNVISKIVVFRKFDEKFDDLEKLSARNQWLIGIMDEDYGCFLLLTVVDARLE
jgi:hypothetical protein